MLSKFLFTFLFTHIIASTAFSYDSYQVSLFGLTPKEKVCSLTIEVDSPHPDSERLISFVNYTDDINNTYDNHWQDSVITIRWSFNHSTKTPLYTEQVDSETVLVNNTNHVEPKIKFSIVFTGAQSFDEEDLRSTTRFQVRTQQKDKDQEIFNCNVEAYKKNKKSKNTL